MFIADFRVRANGADDSDVFEIQDGDTGAAFEFDGSTFALRLGVTRGDGDPALVLTSADGEIAHEVATIDDATWNRFTVNWPGARLSDLAPGRYLMDFVRSAAGADDNIGEGTVTISKGVQA